MASALALIYSLKRLLNKPNYNFQSFKYFQSFSYSLISQILKFPRPSLRLKIILKNYSLQHQIKSFIWFSLTNLKLILFDQPVSHAITTGVWTTEIYKVSNKKKSVKRGRQATIEAGFYKQFERWRGEVEILVREILTIQCFWHREDRIP